MRTTERIVPGSAFGLAEMRTAQRATPEGWLACRTAGGRRMCAPHAPRVRGGVGLLQHIKKPAYWQHFYVIETTRTPNAVTTDDLQPSTLPIPPKRVAVFVEPSPFKYVCGYKNRYCNMIRFLVECGCEVLVITTGRGISAPGADTTAYQDAPEEYFGAKVVSSFSVGCPWYWSLPLTLALSPRIFNEIQSFKPDIIHCTTPGLMVFTTMLYSKLLKVPLVLAYHTHLPKYLPKYNLSFLVAALWGLIRLMHSAAQLTLVTSAMLRDEFVKQGLPSNSVKVWQKGVDSEVFNPRFKSQLMRERMTDGNPDSPVLVHVGRLGMEKNLKFLKGLLTRLPGARLAFVGDGPAREELEEWFKGTPTTFLGMLHVSMQEQHKTFMQNWVIYT